jgi:hypothetical protein
MLSSRATTDVEPDVKPAAVVKLIADSGPAGASTPAVAPLGQLLDKANQRRDTCRSLGDAHNAPAT